MTENIDIAALRNLPLTLRASFPETSDDYTVKATTVVMGRIMRMAKSFNVNMWLWTITGPYIPTALQPSNGEAETLDQAKKDLRAKLDLWFAWVEKQRGGAVWNGNVPLGAIAAPHKPDYKSSDENN